MKKILALVMTCAAFLTGCGAKEAATPDENAARGAAASPSTAVAADYAVGGGDIVEVKEKMFVTQCQDIALNSDEYVGKTVYIEGMYDEFVAEDGTVYRAVVRNSPGCCGDDGLTGLELLCDNAPECKQNDWIAVKGALTPYVYEDGFEAVVISKPDITVKTERGAEFVRQ
ncbi:MAG: hypothetical protein LBL35_05350 [Clostridiales bacterium]|jgi:uncharacterized membrane protein YcgQ (UPF0703/DUF1980 family)|nr:hypothetical protein [Clostridiales bacterium]